MNHITVRRHLAAGIAAGLLALAGTPVAAGLFSATGPVIAIVAEQLFLGEAEGHLNGAGTLRIHSQKNPSLTCSGDFTSSAKAGGMGQLQCSDGATATFTFQRMNAFRGYGSGKTSLGPMTFAYGLEPEQAAAYLKLPGGKKLVANGTQLTLEDL